MTDQIYKHWHLHWDEDDILWLGLDKFESSANTLDATVLNEFDIILGQLLQSDKTAGLAIYSRKKTFILGADVKAFKTLRDEEEAFELIRRGQQLFAKLECLQIPTLALIQGLCLGGGLELTLACRYRIASDEHATQLGLPEVLLGIHPGWGGTVRLPHLIGAVEAFKLMLSGRFIAARPAEKLGLIDVAVPERHLKNAARKILLGKYQIKRKWFKQQLSNSYPVRQLLAKILTQQTTKKVNCEHYPAPFAMIENWRTVGVNSAAAMLQEAKSISRLMFTDAAKNLLRVFELRERLKSFAAEQSIGIEHVHVIGAGTMGGDIAAWCALSGFKVTLEDRSVEAIAPAIKRAYKLFKKKLKRLNLIQAAMDRLMPDVHGYGVASANVIIEAVFEDVAVKQDIFQRLEETANYEAILATNTSSIPLDKIASVLENPERLVGIHFFNPVAQMPLVEVIYGDETDITVVEQASAFVAAIDRLPLPVKSRPGFLVNRVLMPYLLEAMKLYEEGVSASLIDQQAVAFGMPMGPIELADTVGLDVCLHVADNLAQYYNSDIPAKLKQMVQDGQLGKKSKRGFYSYDKQGKPIKPKVKQGHSGADIEHRLILRIINEAAACLREGLVVDEECIDAGLIFGTGFAPFRGGPLHYTKVIGIEQLSRQCRRLTEQHGERFRMDNYFAAAE